MPCGQQVAVGPENSIRALRGGGLGSWTTIAACDLLQGSTELLFPAPAYYNQHPVVFHRGTTVQASDGFAALTWMAQTN